MSSDFGWILFFLHSTRNVTQIHSPVNVEDAVNIHVSIPQRVKHSFFNTDPVIILKSKLRIHFQIDVCL